MDDRFIFQDVEPAISELAVEGLSPITVAANRTIRDSFELSTLRQAVNARRCPGVTDVVLTPDAHVGYGAPIGCVMVSPDCVYPGPVGVDIKCSMSLVQFDLPAEAIADKRIRRQLIDAICRRTPTGPGRDQRSVPDSRTIEPATAETVVCEGATPRVCDALGIPVEWIDRCEDAVHCGHDQTADSLRIRFDRIKASGQTAKLPGKLSQLGSYGGGNHFGECEITRVADSATARRCADVFGLADGRVSFLSHCGSRGFGNVLATNQFRVMKDRFRATGVPFPAGDPYLVYAEIGSHAANDYLDDMALGANFATVNHLLINSLVVEAFESVFPGIKANFVYIVSHNIVRRETLDDRSVLVHRKGATRAFPAGRPQLIGTPFAETGHPILLPGNPIGGSSIMVALPGARKTCYSVNHGAGRAIGRRDAERTLNQNEIDSEFNEADVLFNGRFYPRDEAPAAYKNFDEVKAGVLEAGLAVEVASLSARFVIKDSDKPDD